MFSMSHILAVGAQFSQTFGLPFLLILLMCEEMGFFSPLPGNVVIVYYGIQSRHGQADPLHVLFFSVAGMVIGSSLLYWLASRYGQALIQRVHWLGKLERKLTPMQTLVQRWGPLAFLVARLIPGQRQCVSLLSGLRGMPYKKQFVPSILFTAIVWSLLSMGLGALLG